MRVYAIGDIHGQLDMLRAAHTFIAEDRVSCGDRDAPVVHLGDYCDRGLETAGVLRLLIDGVASGQPWRMVMGNHDRLFRDFLNDGSLRDNCLRSGLTWLTPNMGGRETLMSYGVEAIKATVHEEAVARVPALHRAFLAELETHIALGELLFAHAGIRPGVPLDQQVEDDLIWIRQEFLNDTRDHGALIVHGHTPVEAPMHCGNRVNLDTGAGYFRQLTAAVFEGCDCWVLTAGGREALKPSHAAWL
ncbi:MAG: serine/threonine protein phosphatase [Rhodobacteraceae bacterium]|nr:serine/threonine protein phosphatase [Paracoccaceae bacterium]